MAPYPTAEEIRSFASALGTADQSPFFDRVSPNVVWDVMGTHPAAGHFTSLGKMHDSLQSSPTKPDSYI
jgi:uncharacterized protein